MILGYDFVEERLYSDLLEEEKLFAWAQLAKNAALSKAEKEAVGRFRSTAASFIREGAGRNVHPHQLASRLDALQGRNGKALAPLVKEIRHAKMHLPVDKMDKMMAERLIGKPATSITRNDMSRYKNNLISGLKKISNL